MQSFVRMSKLTDIVGRADYISNEKRQEHIIVERSYADWKPYQEYERSHQKTNKANNEGRELIIALP
ncbi:MAG: MobA/MobL family protein, partial [Ruminococcus sp.]|nr:MobA/MobL family protein [Ruminococcus sp.]